MEKQGNKSQKDNIPFTGANTEVKPAISPNYRDELGRFIVGNEGTMKRYNDAGQLMTAVVTYLGKCNDDKKTPTMTGLALSLGFRSRRSLLNYEKEPGYEFAFEIVTYAKMKIEEFLEERLLDHRNTNIAGLIFNLKNNFDWVDKQDIRMDQRTMQLVGFNFVHKEDEQRESN